MYGKLLGMPGSFFDFFCTTASDDQRGRRAPNTKGQRTLSGSLVFSTLFLGLFAVFGDLVFDALPLAGCTALGSLCDDQMRYVDFVGLATDDALFRMRGIGRCGRKD